MFISLVIYSSGLSILLFSIIKTNNKVGYNTGNYCTHFEVETGKTTKNNIMTTPTALEG